MLSVAAATLRNAISRDGSGSSIGGGSGKKTDRHFRLSPLTTWKPGVVVWWFSYHESDAPTAKEKWGCSVEDIVRVGRVPGGSNGNYAFMVVSAQRTLELIAPTQAIADTWIRQLELARSSTRRALLIQQQDSQLGAAGASAPYSPPDSLDTSSNSEPSYRPYTFATSATNVAGGVTRQSSGTETPTQANPTGMNRSSILRKSLSANALSTPDPSLVEAPSPPQRTLGTSPPARDSVRHSRSVTFDSSCPAAATSLQPAPPMESTRLASASQTVTEKALSGIADALEQTMADLQRFAQTEASPTTPQVQASESLSAHVQANELCDDDDEDHNDAAILASSIRPHDPALATPPPVQRQFRLSPDSPEHPPLPAGLRMSSASTPTGRASQQPQTPPSPHQRPSSMASSVAPIASAAAAVRRRTSSESDRTLHRNTDESEAHREHALGDRYSVIVPTPRAAQPPLSPIHGSAQELGDATAHGPPTSPDSDKVLERQPTVSVGGDKSFRPLTVTLVTDGLDWNIMDALAMLNGSPTSPKGGAVVPQVPPLTVAGVPVLQQPPAGTCSGKLVEQVKRGSGDGLMLGDRAGETVTESASEKRGEDAGSKRAHV
ncbi:hypothetical protein BCR44DRAFT_1499712 [Catenaria anguillulae PL171]|uniref:PH domain-containing protein n=1 Tax=Catenaria anguillulae PL171 TaxID=765915 RepID=A0A1Y2HLU0_9FUNG|nr:hypothetical protein BCR44DRAFT_1499712 [Catenaria anguillulae PL171]